MVLISCAIVALIFSVLGFIFSVWNFIELRAMKLSTHKIQFMPAEEALGSDFEELDDKSRSYLDSDDLDFDPLYEDLRTESINREIMKNKT